MFGGGGRGVVEGRPGGVEVQMFHPLTHPGGEELLAAFVVRGYTGRGRRAPAKRHR